MKISDRVPVGRMRLGLLRRLLPISSDWGFDRGLPIDRYYIEAFLQRHSSDIYGRVLEISDSTYTYKFGGDRVVKSDVLDVTEGNRAATIVGDLTCADHISSDIFDCIIFTQTLQYIYDVRAAIQQLYRILKPGGVLLVSLPVTSKITLDEGWDDYWRFTSLSSQRLFEEVFSPEKVSVEAYGNVLTAISFLHGLAAEELKEEELEYMDPEYELLITVRAVKPFKRLNKK